jgi:hypothetical protein
LNKLINLAAIIDSPIINDPWPYKIIDNVLPPDVFEKFRKAATILSSVEKDDQYYADGIWPNEFVELGLESSLADDVILIADQLLTIKTELLMQFPKHINSQVGYYNIPRFNYSIGNQNSAIHDEGTSKTMALVIYLIPAQTAGTRLYNGPDETSFVTEVEWKPNRAMLMMSQPGVTWHSYKGNGFPRYTLNLYYEKMESLDYFSNLGLDRKLWFYDMLGQNQLYQTV